MVPLLDLGGQNTAHVTCCILLLRFDLDTHSSTFWRPFETMVFPTPPPWLRLLSSCCPALLLIRLPSVSSVPAAARSCSLCSAVGQFLRLVVAWQSQLASLWPYTLHPAGVPCTAWPTPPCHSKICHKRNGRRCLYLLMVLMKGLVSISNPSILYFVLPINSKQIEG